MQRYGLTDEQWLKIENLLPGRKEDVGVTAKNNRLFVEAVLYRYRSGIPWRCLPKHFGQNTLATSVLCTLVIPDGVVKAFGIMFLRRYQQMLITSIQC